MKPKCLICKKIIKIDEIGFFDGGEVLISFGYGSRYDQKQGSPYKVSSSKLEKMLNCEIRARICDDCFEEVFPLCEGYYVTNKIEEKRIV
jgi:uncharacterized protein YlaI